MIKKPPLTEVVAMVAGCPDEVQELARKLWNDLDAAPFREAETIAKYLETTADQMEDVRAALTPSLPTVKPLLLSFAADIRAGKHKVVPRT